MQASVVREINPGTEVVKNSEQLGQEALEASGLDGAQLAIRTVIHHFGNDLSLTRGYAELFSINRSLPDAAKDQAREILRGVEGPIRKLDQLSRIVSLVVDPEGGLGAKGKTLDLERSSQLPEGEEERSAVLKRIEDLNPKAQLEKALVQAGKEGAGVVQKTLDGPVQDLAGIRFLLEAYKRSSDPALLEQIETELLNTQKLLQAIRDADSSKTKMSSDGVILDIGTKEDDPTQEHP